VKYSVWIFSKDFRVFRFYLKRPLFILAIGVLVSSFVCLVFFPFLLWQYWKKHKELQTAQNKLTYQTQTYGEKLEKLTKEVLALKETERRLKEALNIKTLGEGKRKERVARGGEGGLENVLEEEALENLIAEVKLRHKAFEELEKKLAQKLDRLKHTPSLWPVRGEVTSGYGWRKSPFCEEKLEFHTGIDISAPPGTPIRAPADGKVEKIWYDRALGLTIRIRHGYGIETVYGHLSKALVREGEAVKRGQIIGMVGNTGSRSTGPHLHYEVRLGGRAINPRHYLPD
jgi:murein DD-endopeptidase MepM/ murein hydrolase activator NlpD